MTSGAKSVLGKRDPTSLFGVLRNRPAPPTAEQLRTYYSQWFPAPQLCAALDVQDEAPLATREFVLRVQNDGATHFREQRAAHRRPRNAALVAVQPPHVDVGGAWVDAEGALADRATRREFVLDVDINDYERVCCAADDPSVCERCWTLLRGAALVGEHLLSSLLGVRRTVWTFSGRRGVHCWVFDRRVLALDTDARRQLLDLLTGPLARSDVGARMLCADHYARYIGCDRQGVDIDTAVDRLFPRFDSSVSKSTNHLLRAPFSIHGGSGCAVLPLELSGTLDEEGPPRLHVSRLLEGEEDAVQMLRNRIRLWQSRLGLPE